MKTNITLRIDEEARKFIKDNGLNASSLFETFIFKDLMNVDFYIELSRQGNKVYEKIVKIKKIVGHSKKQNETESHSKKQNEIDEMMKEIEKLSLLKDKSFCRKLEKIRFYEEHIKFLREEVEDDLKYCKNKIEDFLK